MSHNQGSVADKSGGGAAPGLSLVIPAYNECAGIGRVLTHVKDILKKTDLSFEILVIDDGSEDETAQVARAIDGVRVYCHPQNKGYGAAIKTGMRKARHEFIAILDADGTYPVERIPELADRMIMEELDMIVGDRSRGKVSVAWVRRPAKWAITRLAEFVVGTTIPDLNSGLRIFRRDLAYHFFDLLPDGFSFTTTITLAMMTNGFLVRYAPIEYHARIGKSKIRPIRDTINFVQLILRIALYFRPMKVFLPLGLLFIVLSIVWGFYSAIGLGQLADVSTSVILLTGVQAVVVGLLADLINRRLTGYKRNELHDMQEFKDE